MTLIGVDLNATRARALHGTAAGPAPLALEAGQAELPLALSLEARTPVVGRAGVALCRKLPHLACLDFLPHLGTSKQWTAGRHRLDATAALGLVCQHLQPRFAKASGIALSLPAYLEDTRADLVRQIAEKARWKVLGAVPTPIAAVLAARDQLPWSGMALVVDVDGHAMVFSAVALEDERARLVGVQTSPKLALGFWLRALLDGVARRCVRMSRRDPRASADAEQSLYEQLLAVMERSPSNGIIELNIQSAQWFQNLMLPAEELAVFAGPLAEQARAELLDFLGGLSAFAPAGVVILTNAAGRLPGLASALESRARSQVADSGAGADSDFGEGLLDERLPATTHVLEPDAVAWATFELAARFHRGELAGGWHDDVALPAAESDPVRNGPARLHYRGQDHLLKYPRFTLGRDPACDLGFESDLYPSVSARHCEIIRDQRGYLLRDRSRHGTLVNDQHVQGQAVLKPGDWIRLGPGGPLLRFLGQPADPFKLVTTA